MRLELTGRHVEITPALRRLVEGKLSKLERVVNDRAVSAHAVLTRERHRHRTDITLHARGEKFLHGVGDTSAWTTSVAQAMDKICQQFKRVKGKWEPKGRRRAGDGSTFPADRAATGPIDGQGGARESARMPRILHAMRQPIKPMTIADAAREVDAGGDGVVVFRDMETASVSVLFRRRDGELTLVQTEA
jgi:ribosome hibernation promoting factor